MLKIGGPSDGKGKGTQCFDPWKDERAHSPAINFQAYNGQEGD